LVTDRVSATVIAVVDDDSHILRSLGDLLESADYGVRLFTSPAALLKSACLSEIDCLISDIDMPGIDGFELLRLGEAARPGLPIILITGYPERLKQLPSSSFIGSRFFIKPFEGSTLLSTIGEAISSFRK